MFGCRVVSALARRWLHGPRVDEPLEVEDYAGTTAPGSGSLRSLLANRLGSIAIAVSVATGAVASEVEYDSFGQRTYVTGAEADAPRYGYTGREHDAESGLIYYRARHYDPALGQFLQQDPIGFAAGDLNLYAYVENDPFNATDPSGLTSSAESGATSSASTQAIRSAVRTVGLGVMNLAGAIGGFLAGVDCGTAIGAYAMGTGGGGSAAFLCGTAALDAVTPGRLPNRGTSRPEPGGPSCTGTRCTCSFDGSTLVVTDQGLVRIDALDPETMQVLSRDAATGETAFRAFGFPSSADYDVTVTVGLADADTGAVQTIVSNVRHPFFAVPSGARLTPASAEGHWYEGPVAGGAWIDAAYLRPGDALQQADGGWAEVVSVDIADAPLVAWNMSVAETETYFVTGLV
ncbi:RHS repeat-associated core domain-containing protein [Jannaschia pohangensis]|uniref:RHS repeat-associated core domain-containing protein n=1 Tax=Jannaschia pohangensis TaxID=390807 RepID=A0A1I3PYI3_9RHOB|nr:RHS repeat-associated core domain-containing protein [Jannaschia pohangensis]SFJ26251.1 RHS repeat-associated core domain-containing protein [Jannaschia pohangensis]